MIFPIPKSYEKQDGTYTFKSKLTGSDLYAFYCECLSSDEINFQTDNDLSKEEYILEICESGVEIASSCDDGKFRAVTSLFQLYKRGDGKVGFAKLKDKPDFDRRAYMLDIGTCMPKPDTIKQFVDILAMLKYNEFQLYMDNFCFKYPLFPEVTEGYECLTSDDIEDLGRYCRERHIDLVPNQNCFGHLSAWLARDEYRHLEVGYPDEKTETINPLLPESCTLIDKIFDSLLPYFESEYVNIGHDEVGGIGKFQLEEYCNKYGKDTLFMENLNRVAGRISQKYGKKVQLWSDMIINYPRVLDKLPDGAVVLEWGYELMSERSMEKHCRYLHDKNIEFYVCPSCNHHFSLTGRFEVSSYNIRTSAELGRIYGAKGCMLTDWGMRTEGRPHFGVWSFLPAALGGQYFWNVEEEQKGLIMETYFERLSRDFLDFFVFGGAKISEHIQRLANYNLLEPERVRLGTMCGMTLWQDIDKTSYGAYFDLKECGADFYFNNIIRYVEEIAADVRKVEMDNGYSREIILSTKIVSLAAHFCKLRKNESIASDEAEKLIYLIDEMYEEFKSLWNMRNYEKGVECFLGILSARKVDLERFVS